MAPGGRAIVVWLRSDGETQRVLARSFSPAGVPGPVVRLSPPGPHVSLKPPQVGVAANGTATVMWQERGRLRARVWPASGSPGAVRTVVRSPRRSWRLAVGARGRAVVVWQSRARTRLRPRELHARWLSVAGSPGRVTALGAPGEELPPWSTPQVAVAASGRAVVAWLAYDGDRVRARARGLTAAGAPGPLVDISGARRIEADPHVGIDAAGNAIVAWTDQSEDGSHQGVRARRLPARGRTGRSFAVFSGRPFAFGAQVGMTPDGRTVFAWGSAGAIVEDAPGDNRVQIRTRAVDGTLGPVMTVSDAADADSGSAAQLAVAANGSAALTWEIGFGLGRNWRARGAAIP